MDLAFNLVYFTCQKLRMKEKQCVKIMAGDFPGLKKQFNLQIEKVQQVPGKIIKVDPRLNK